MLANGMATTNGGKNGSVSLFSVLPGMPNKGNKLLASGYQLQTTTFDPLTKQYVWIFVKTPSSPIGQTVVQQSNATDERIETLEKLLKEQTYLASLTDKQKIEYQKKKAEQDKKEAEELKKKEQQAKAQQAREERQKREKAEESKIQKTKIYFFLTLFVFGIIVVASGLTTTFILVVPAFFLIKWIVLKNKKGQKHGDKVK